MTSPDPPSTMNTTLDDVGALEAEEEVKWTGFDVEDRQEMADAFSDLTTLSDERLSDWIVNHNHPFRTNREHP